MAEDVAGYVADGLKALIKFARKVFDRIETILDAVGDDAMVQQAMEADLGLPAGALNLAKQPRPSLNAIDDYIRQAEPTAENALVAAAAIEQYIGFWKDVFEAARTEDTSLVVDELVYQLLQTTTVQLLRFEYPTLYRVMRIVGVLQQNTRLALEDVFVPELPANLFTGKYFDTLADQFERNYLRFRLEQGEDIGYQPTGDLRQRQLDFDVFWRSDALMLVPTILADAFVKDRLEKLLGVRVELFYGWELPPRRVPTPQQPEPIPLAEHIASRGSTVRVSMPDGPQETSSATLTQFLLVDAQGRIGWLLSLRGALVMDGVTDDEDRPLKMTWKIDARDGLDLIVWFSGDDRLSVVGPPTAGLKVTIEPTETSVRGPAFAIPARNRTRLEIGDFSFSIDISDAGLKIRGALIKSAIVLKPSEADSFLQEALPKKETRVEFDLGAAVDSEKGFYLEGGNRLSTSIAVNHPIGPLTFRSIELSLTPNEMPVGSEVRLTAVTSLSLRSAKGLMNVSVEQLGMSIDIGTTSGTVPDDATSLLGGLLYIRTPKFRAPSGIGIVIDSCTASGGGFLFHDEENDRYAGVFQLEICNQVSVKAVALLDTRLPGGQSGYSFLIIASIEFEPPLGPFIGISLYGLGVIIGINRTLDADALRKGLRNRVLDAILFPDDLVANAGRLVNAVGTVFPAAKDRTVIGFSAKLGFGSPPFVTLELAVVREFGDSPKWAVVGQLHAGLPRTKPVLVLHVDGAGIWDLNRGEFSLDATMYESRIGPVTLGGDVALRTRKGPDSYFLFSAGGYHPEFAVPAHFPSLERIRISLVDRPNARLYLTGYFAITSNTKQFGAEVNLFLKGGPISLECVISFDALITDDAGWVVAFDVEIKIKFKGRTLFGVDVHGRFFGAEPKRVVAKLSISLWLFDIDWSFDHTWGKELPPSQVPLIDPLGALVNALRNPNAWSANLPPRGRTLVTLRKRPGDQVRVHPLGGLEVRQSVVPLGIQINRYAGNAVPGRRFDLTGAKLGGRTVPNPRLLDELFAPADFLRLTDGEKLARPSFEALPAGVALQPQGITFGGQTSGTAGQASASIMDFEDVILGAGGEEARPGPRAVSNPAAAAATAFGPAARSPLRTTGLGRFESPASGPALRRRGFVVASVDDLSVVSVDGAPAERSFTAARQAMERHRADNPHQTTGLQVVPATRSEGLS